MYFLNITMLYLAPVAAVLAALLVLVNYRRRRMVQEQFGSWQLLEKTSKPLPRSRYIARAALAGLTAALVMVALSRPLVPNGTKMIAQGTVDVMAVVDVSRSMAAMDYDGKVPPSAVAKRLIEPTAFGRPEMKIDETPGTRLEMVRHIMLDHMLPTLEGNQFGIVSYAGEAFPQAFLTRDAAALKWVIDRGVTISSAPGEGSDIGKALELALAMLDADSPTDHEKLLILFSDGGNTAEEDDANRLTEMVSELRQRGVKVIVVAMGNVMPAKIPVSKLAQDDDVALALQQNGKQWYETNGQIERSGMNAQLLAAIASRAGGTFIHMQDAKDLNLMDYVGKHSQTSVPGTVELFPWALACALISLVLTFAVVNGWRRRNES